MNSFCPYLRIVFALLIGSYPTVAFSSAKRVTAGELTPMVVTSKGGFPEPLHSTAWSITALETEAIKGNTRSLPEALSGIPSIMVQKTALGQSSPYIRGLTGYHNVLLVDGIRLNHSAMRSGPNQYWSTVELFGTDRVEALRGTHGVLFGADAVGGIVNSLSSEPFYSNQKIIDPLSYLVVLLQQSVHLVQDFQLKFPLQNGLLKFLIQSVHLATLMEEGKLVGKKILAMM